MPGMIANLFRRLDQLSEALAFAGVFLLAGAIAVSIVDIGGRKTIGFSVFGVNDIVPLLVMGCISLAMPFTFIREGHVGVEFVTDPLPRRALAALKFGVALLSFVAVVVLERYSYGQAALQVGKGDSSLTLGIPIAWYWAPVLIGLGLSAFASLAQVLRYLLAVLRGVDPLEAAGSAPKVDF